MSYRPITDVWILARPKVAYYGAYPAGFLHRARALLGVSIDQTVLHVCAGRVRSYPFAGLGRHDKTVDRDGTLKPDYVRDVRLSLPVQPGGWPAVLADPPYTEADAAHYAGGADFLPDAHKLLALCLSVVRPGGRVGFLHYIWPRPPSAMRDVKSVALIAVAVGYGNRMRAFSVFERGPK